MARKKRVSNAAAIFVALGALTGLGITGLFGITDTGPMAFVVGLFMVSGYAFSYLINQFIKGFRDKD